jgi:hypothetical protein
MHLSVLYLLSQKGSNISPHSWLHASAAPGYPEEHSFPSIQHSPWISERCVKSVARSHAAGACASAGGGTATRRRAAARAARVAKRITMACRDCCAAAGCTTEGRGNKWQRVSQGRLSASHPRTAAGRGCAPRSTQGISRHETKGKGARAKCNRTEVLRTLLHAVSIPRVRLVPAATVASSLGTGHCFCAG